MGNRDGRHFTFVRVSFKGVHSHLDMNSSTPRSPCLNVAISSGEEMVNKSNSVDPGELCNTEGPLMT